MIGLIIFLLLFGIPIAEIALFIQVGDLIGLWPTLGTIVLTALAGTALVRAQGIGILTRIQAETQAGRLPVGELISGACLVVAGLLLLTPGFLTDAIGFLLLIPVTRSMLGAFAVQAMMRRGGTAHFSAGGFRQRSGGHGPGGRSDTIDGEYSVVDPDTAPPSEPGTEPPPTLEDRKTTP